MIQNTVVKFTVLYIFLSLLNFCQLSLIRVMRKHILTNQKKKDNDNDKYVERKKKDNNNDKYVERRHLDIDI